MSFKIAEIWRYPVKSMGGELLASAQLTKGGLEFDRGWAVHDKHSGRRLDAKLVGRLLKFSARCLEGTSAGLVPHAEITLPNGETVRTDDEDVNAVVSEALQEPVVLLPLSDSDDQGKRARKSFFDAWTLHLLTDASLRYLEALLPDTQVDRRRFRPNLLLEDLTSAPAPIETEWVGRAVRLGNATVQVDMPCPRCVMATREQPGLDRAGRILRTLTREADECLGVYASTVGEGEVAVGEAFILVDS